MRRPRARRALLALAAALALVATACSTGGNDRGAPTTTSPGTTAPDQQDTSPVQDGIRIEILSSQPDRVTGGDARIRVTPAPGDGTADLTVQLGSKKVTDQLAVADGRLEGVVTGFIEGNNTLTATGGGREQVLRVRDWPLSGPVISGPQLPLVTCSTEAHGLGAPTDDQCSAARRVTWRYLTTGGKVAELPDPSQVPADLASATVDGQERPLYVRYEQGVINRSVYEIASVEPNAGDPEPTDDGWHHQLVYRFAGSGRCGTTYGQGTSSITALDPELLRRGYAVATATFNDTDVQCNDVVSAETTMMVRERFIEAFGVPDRTVGVGSGGGAAQLHLIAQDYPGLVDGIVATRPLPDVLSVATGATDCGLLLHYFGSETGKALDAEQRQAITGFASPNTCLGWVERFGPALDPTTGCDPAAARAGLRCTLWESFRNQLGIDQQTGRGLRAFDNVGLQYGLEALNDGTISVDQFLDLNEAVGGYDAEGAIVADRPAADLPAVQAAYETGRVSMGGGDQLSIPTIDVDVSTDRRGDVFDRLRPFSLRDRLTADGTAEDAPGFQVWTWDAGLDPAANPPDPGPTVTDVELQPLEVLGRWLDALDRDRQAGDRATRLQRTRPDDAVDRCLGPKVADPVGGVGIYDDPGPCRDDHPIAGDPRTTAGAPRSDEILKCNLKAIDPADYAVPFTDAQQQRLAKIFADGVCDWRTPGAGETVPANPDRTYQDVTTPEQSV